MATPCIPEEPPYLCHNYIGRNQIVTLMVVMSIDIFDTLPLC